MMLVSFRLSIPLKVIRFRFMIRMNQFKLFCDGKGAVE